MLRCTVGLGDVADIVTQQLLENIDGYIETLFSPADNVLAQNLEDAAGAGLPSINVSPNQGKLLYLLVKLAAAKRVLEIGTLGGYSTTWLARGLPAEGVVVTLERDAKHADVARNNLARAGLSRLVDIRVSAANDSLRSMIQAGEEAFDVIFIDADKPGYIEYLDLSLQLSHPGTLILADNVIRNGRVIDANPEDGNARGARAFNQAIARHPRLESIVLPIFRGNIDGLSLSLVR